MLPVIAVATWLFRRQVVPAYMQARERVSVVNAQLQENVAGVRVTQAFGREGRNAEQFLDSASAYRESRLRAQTYISIYFPFIQFLSDLAGAIVLGVGAVRLRDGTLSAGTLIAFFLYLDAFFGPVQNLSQVFDGYQQATRRPVAPARPAAHRRPRRPSRPTRCRSAAHLRGAIALRDVHFRYTGATDEALAGRRHRDQPGRDGGAGR